MNCRDITRDRMRRGRAMMQSMTYYALGWKAIIGYGSQADRAPLTALMTLLVSGKTDILKYRRTPGASFQRALAICPDFRYALPGSKKIRLCPRRMSKLGAAASRL